MEFNIDPKDLNLQDAAGMQLVEVIRNLADESGTTDYEDLENLPKINGVTLVGNKSTSDLNLAPTDAQVETAVDAWLEDNVDPETGYVLDSTLTMSNAAAPADKVGELKSAFEKPIEYGGTWKEFSYPQTFTGDFKPVKIFTNGAQFRTDFDKDDWKVSAEGAKTYYVDPSGTYLNDGLSRANPITMYNAINRSSEGDTIIVMEGDYRNDTVTNAAIPSITKSLNIIGEGDVRFSKSGLKTPTFDSETGLYTVSQAAMQGVYDPAMNIYYTVVYTLADCQATVNSIYYGSAPTVYINMTYQHDIIGVYNDVMFVVDNSTADVQVYVENIEFMGGGCCFQTTTTNAHSCLVVFEKCRFTYNVSASNNTVKIASAKAIFHKCVARYSENDGFAYTVSENGADTGFVEIDCEGFSNGYNLSSDSSNGSTAHGGICGIRINGKYYENKGANVADVQEGTQTINCGCIAANSTASQDGYNEGFACQQSGATQWLYSCIAFGNFYDFYGVPETEQIADASYHNTSNYSFDYSGTLTDNNPKDLAVMLCENGMMQLV